jgi:hypothetical protein
MKEGDYVVCYTKFEQIGGMSFRQNYFKVGKKYKVYTDLSGELVVKNELGWSTGADWSAYLCSEKEYREKKLIRINDK